MGNINQFTFANAVVAANIKARELFKLPLHRIYVIHSRESDNKLEQSKDWVNHLGKFNIDNSIIISRVLELTSTLESVELFVSYLETIVKGVSPGSFIIDLSNGTTFHKTMLSTAAYVLDLPHQFTIDIQVLLKINRELGFFGEDVLGGCYIEAPDSKAFDRITYLNLTEMIRYKKIIDTHTNAYTNMDVNYADKEFFRDNLLHSIELKLKGDLTKNNSIYRIAASSIGAGLEELVSLLLDSISRKHGHSLDSRMTFGPKLDKIESKVQKCAPPEFDLVFFGLLNKFMLHLRNSTTHKGRLLTKLEKFKAELAVKMSFPFIEFYTDIIYPLLLSDEDIEKPRQFRKLSAAKREKFYAGLDGDNTGALLEELFVACGDESEFRKMSTSIEGAIRNIATAIDKKWGPKAVIFAAGDDLLFKGALNITDLQLMQKTYFDNTGLTCSIGYGKSFQEVYLALKLAKTEPGKNSIMGIEFV